MAWANGRVLFLYLALTAAGHAATATDAVIAEVAGALDKGDTSQAIRLTDAGLAEKDVTPLQRGRMLLNRGLAHELDGSRDEALVDFTGAIQTRALPNDERAQALLQRGFLLDGMERLTDAAKDYSAVVLLRTPVASTALNNRANIYRRQNRLDEAKRDYLAALSAGSEHPQYPYFGLGQIAEARHDLEAARGFYAKAVTAEPDYTLAADRLTALGGPPEQSLAEPDQIVLRPPTHAVAPAPEKIAALAPRPKKAAAPAQPQAQLALRPALDGPAAAAEPQVQLGAWRSEPEAQAGWDAARDKAGSVLAGLSGRIVAADLPGKGRYFRLRVATPDPAGLCGHLRAAGVACLPAHS